MFVQPALASDVAAPVAVTTATTAASASATPPPGGAEMLLWNVGFVAIMIIMFYLLLIRPQQNRYKEHAQMIKGLKKSDKIVLQSGLIATIDHVGEGQEMTVDLGHGQKVQIFRSAIAGKYDDIAKK